MRSSFAVPGLCLLSGLVSGCFGGDADGNGDGVAPGGRARITTDTVFYEGAFQLSGTVTFAEGLPAGTRIQLNLAEATDFTSGALDTGNELTNETVHGYATQVDWTIEDIAAGSYLVALSAELSGDGWIGEGDQGGYYGGTAEAPAQYQSEAQVIEVTSSLSALDFGAGPMRCKAHWGGACAADEDCRGASCEYDSGLRTTLTSGKCSASVCETPASSCEPFGTSGDAGTMVESDCFGGP
jgi:hypothetical protein